MKSKVVIISCIIIIILVYVLFLINRKNTYDEAVKQYGEKQYFEAYKSFMSLGDYKDAKSLANVCEEPAYGSAIEHMLKKEFEKAIEYFSILQNSSNFKVASESKGLIVEINKELNNLKDKYASAMALYNLKKYDEAMNIFAKILSYKDSQKKCYECFNNMVEFVECPAGSFIMGVQDDSFVKYVDAAPHKVTITKPFKISKYEVTQSLYKAITGENPSRFKGENNPVENVTWKDAMAFCLTATKAFEKYLPDGYEYSLPTDAQWEYACRAGTTSSFNNGKNIIEDEKQDFIEDIAWCDSNTTHPVGLKKPNAWGLYDMHGNVWEWCKDDYANDVSGLIKDPIYLDVNSTLKVCRGGAFDRKISDCRSACRFNADKNSSGDTVGFRIVIVPSAYKCYRNMNAISGSIEMYNMDHEPGLTTYNEEVYDKLVREKYINNNSKIIKCCPYSNENSYYLKGELTKDVDIYCPEHGRLSELRHIYDSIR